MDSRPEQHLLASPSFAWVENVIFVHLRIVPTVFSEDSYREAIGGARVIEQGADTVVDVGLEDDVLGLRLGIREPDRLLACALDLLLLFGGERGHWGCSFTTILTRVSAAVSGRVSCRGRGKRNGDAASSSSPACSYTQFRPILAAF